jgi:hypothetical protein
VINSLKETFGENLIRKIIKSLKRKNLKKKSRLEDFVKNFETKNLKSLKINF